MPKTPSVNAKAPDQQAPASTNPAPQNQQAPAQKSGKMHVDVTRPLGFGKHKGKMITDPSVNVGWVLYMLDKVDEATCIQFERIAHDKCDDYILQTSAGLGIPIEAIEAELHSNFGKSKLMELRLQDKMKYCEMIEQSMKVRK